MVSPARLGGTFSKRSVGSQPIASCCTRSTVAGLCRPARQTATSTAAKSFDLSINKGRQLGNSHAVKLDRILAKQAVDPDTQKRKVPRMRIALSFLVGVRLL